MSIKDSDGKAHGRPVDDLPDIRLYQEQGRAKAAELRTIRADLHRQMKQGELALSSALSMPELQRERVITLLHYMPGIRMPTARSLMADLRLGEHRRVSTLGPYQKHWIGETIDAFVAERNDPDFRMRKRQDLVSLNAGIISVKDALMCESLHWMSAQGLLCEVPGIAARGAMRILTRSHVPCERRVAFLTETEVNSISRNADLYRKLRTHERGRF